MNEEVEYISYPKLKHIKVFLDDVKYRNLHMHGEIEICFLLKGEAIFKTNKKEITLKTNDAILLNSNEAHSIESINDSSLGLFIQVSNHFLREYTPILRNEIFETSLLSTYLSLNQMHDLFALALTCAFSYFKEEKYYQFEVMANLSKIFKVILENIPHQTISEKEIQRNKKNTARINQVVAYIDEHLQEKMKLETIASLLDITPTYLSHLFSDYFGMNFQSYINSKRFEEALRLMSETNKTMLDISIESGFSDQKYMTKMFSQKLGLTPKAFANKNKEISLDNKENKHKDILEHIYNAENSLDILNNYSNKQ